MKINIGCGERNFGDDWIHIDGGDYNHLDYKNITKLELEDNTVDLMYASHVLEYFDRKKAKSILKEWNRVLKPNGELRIAVPDFYSMVQLYFLNNIPLEKFLGPLYGKMKMGKKLIYHKTVYDWNSLTELLTKTGYSNFSKYDWKTYPVHVEHDDHSQAYIPHMDKENGKLISLNVKCYKL
jgi:predicted SAM-dependent methyltransferase